MESKALPKLRPLYQGMAVVVALAELVLVILCSYGLPHHGELNSCLSRSCSISPRSACISGSVAAGLLLKPVCVPDSLRYDISANLFWLGICQPEKLVATGSNNFTTEYSGLVGRRSALVETSAVVVVGLPRTTW